MSKSEYAPKELYELLFLNMRRENALVLRLCLETGMRVGDAVALKVATLRDARRLESNGAIYYEISYLAQKTGKCGNVQISTTLRDELFTGVEEGAVWLFPSRAKCGHRTRQAVWRDVRNTARRLALPLHITPHSARKTFAVELTARKGIEATQQALQHDRISTTALYYAYANRGVYNVPDVPLGDDELERIAVKVADLLAQKLGLNNATE